MISRSLVVNNRNLNHKDHKVKTEAQKIYKKLIANEALTYEDRTFLIGFILFALEFQDFIKGVDNG
jgi:hypothetical protein